MGPSLLGQNFRKSLENFPTRGPKITGTLETRRVQSDFVPPVGTKLPTRTQPHPPVLIGINEVDPWNPIGYSTLQRSFPIGFAFGEGQRAGRRDQRLSSSDGAHRMARCPNSLDIDGYRTLNFSNNRPAALFLSLHGRPFQRQRLGG
jgi:hypothetical protein